MACSRQGNKVQSFGETPGEVLSVDNQSCKSNESRETGAPNEKNTKNASNAVSCFFVSFYDLLKGYLCELTLFDLFGCGS